LQPFGLFQALLRLGWQKNRVRNFQKFTRSHLTKIRWFFSSNRKNGERIQGGAAIIKQTLLIFLQFINQQKFTKEKYT
jgi:hypothetical protein